MYVSNIEDSDRSLTKAPGKAFFDYGQLSKLILEMPIKSWNSKLNTYVTHQLITNEW